MRRLLADEAGSCPEVEAPAVVGALEHVAEHLALHERVALVWASVVEGVQLVVDAQDDDLAVAGVDDGPIAGQNAHRNTEPVSSGGRLLHGA
jgi:hypothetical protein